MRGPTLTVEDLLSIKAGDVLTFDYPVNRPVDLLLNGNHKFVGRVVSTGRHRALQVTESQRKLAES